MNNNFNIFFQSESNKHLIDLPFDLVYQKILNEFNYNIIKF